MFLGPHLQRNILAIALGLATSSSIAADCKTIDFLALDLSENSLADYRALHALKLAYPDISISQATGMLSVGGLGPIPLGTFRSNVSPATRLQSPSVLEQFAFVYPLDFDPKHRLASFHDPGRLRNDAFFRLLYFQSEAEARETMRLVSFEGLSDGAVWVTGKHGVACQLQAVVGALAASSADFGAVFETPGGGFNWRLIGGTERLSAHSFGIAVDLNPALGGYWRWSGRLEGDAGAFDNRIPEAVVSTFERFGFIWGGKWHHFDGMHFEYRPELILHSRIVSGETGHD